MFVRKWTSGRGRHAVATSEKGHVYVSEHGLSDVRDESARTGPRVEKFSTAGNLLATLRNDSMCLPEAIAVRANSSEPEAEDVFVLDASEVAVLKFRVCGAKVELVNRIHCDALCTPAGLALHRDRLVITDAETHQVHVLSMEGRLHTSFGSEGVGPGQFAAPSGVAVCASRGEIFVCDTGNDRIQVFRMNGDFVRSWGASGESNGFFRRPVSVAISESLGVVAIADRDNNRIQAFDSVTLGRLVWVISAHIEKPSAIAFDIDDDVLVADAHGAQWFAPPGDGDSSSSEEEENVAENDEEQVCRKEKAHVMESPRDQMINLRGNVPAKLPLHVPSPASNVHRRKPSSSPRSTSSKYTAESFDDESDEEEAENHGANTNDVKSPKRPRPNATAQRKLVVRQDAWAFAESKAKSPLSKIALDAPPGRRVHQQYIRDALDRKEEVLALRRQVTDLENHKAIVLEEKCAMDRQIDATLDMSETSKMFAGIELQQSGSRMNALVTEADVEACQDPLLLEERLIELRIIRKDLERSLPDMRHQVADLEQLASKRKRRAQRLEETLDGSIVDVPQLSERCQGLRDQVEACEGEITRMAAEHKLRLIQMSEDKAKIAAALSKASMELESLRHQIGRAHLRNKLAEEHVEGNREDTEELMKLRQTFASLGGEEKLVRLAFASVLAQGQHDLDCEQVLHALRFCAQFVIGKSDAVRSLTLGDVEQYVSLVTQADTSTDPLRLNFAGFREAFYDLHKPRTTFGKDQRS